MKKIYSVVILFGILILISNSVVATEYWNDKENKKKENAFQSALSSYMETFMTEETPEEDRIISYEFTGYSDNGETMENNQEKLTATISFRATPVNKEKTTWLEQGDYCFAVFSKVNDEYVLDRISRYPDYYDEFLERFEAYQKNQELSETTTIQGEKQENLANQEIQFINYSLVVGCAILFVVSSGVLVVWMKNTTNIFS